MGGCVWGVVLVGGGVLVLLFKQKTAYVVLISDWSADVCSSDLPWRLRGLAGACPDRECSREAPAFRPCDRRLSPPAPARGGTGRRSRVRRRYRERCSCRAAGRSGRTVKARFRRPPARLSGRCGRLSALRRSPRACRRRSARAVRPPGRPAPPPAAVPPLGSAH